MSSTLKELSNRVQARRELPPPAVRKVVRQTAEVSLSDIADVVGVTRQAVGLWESGSRTPRGENLTAYVSVLRELSRAVSL